VEPAIAPAQAQFAPRGVLRTAIWVVSEPAAARLRGLPFDRIRPARGAQTFRRAQSQLMDCKIPQRHKIVCSRTHYRRIAL